MIEKYLETEGPDKGRVNDIDIATDLADAEDAWRDENDGIPMLSPPERLGKPQIHFRDIINDELKRLIEGKINSDVAKDFEKIYDDPSFKENDPELSDEKWHVYRIATKLTVIGIESGFDYQTCSEILEFDFLEAFETAYGYLTMAGLDADEILAEFMEA